jgi:hypothetical protein
MSVLLVSRGTMSGGQLIGQCLSERLGFRYVTREVLSAAVNAHGDLASRALESLAHASRDYARFSALRRPYTILMRLALLEYAQQGNLAYFGYSGHLLVEGIAHFVRVRLLAPAALRVQMTIRRMGGSEDDARDYIQRVDEERVRWARFVYGRDIRDPGQYDLCINMEKADENAVCDMLAYFVRHEAFRPTPASLAALDDLMLSTRVLSELVLHPETYELEVGAKSRKGTVLLEGPYLEEKQLERVLELAHVVPGVKAVDYQPGYAPAMALST